MDEGEPANLSKVSYTPQDQGCAQASEGKQPSATGSIYHREAKGGTRPATSTTTVPKPHHAADDSSVDDELVYHANHHAAHHFAPAAHRAYPAPIPPVHGAPTSPSAPANPSVFPGPPEGEPDGWSVQHDLGLDHTVATPRLSSLPYVSPHQVLPAELFFLSKRTRYDLTFLSTLQTFFCVRLFDNVSFIYTCQSDDGKTPEIEGYHRTALGLGRIDFVFPISISYKKSWNNHAQNSRGNENRDNCYLHGKTTIKSCLGLFRSPTTTISAVPSLFI